MFVNKGQGIMVRHIMPNVLPSLVVLTLLEMGSVLMILGELGFVGVFIGGGVQTGAYDDSIVSFADIPEWGAMLADGRGYLRSAPWVSSFPGLALTLTVLAANLVGDGLQEAFRPR